MFPDLVDIGFLHLKTYGACMATGFLLCWHLVERLECGQETEKWEMGKNILQGPAQGSLE